MTPSAATPGLAWPGLARPGDPGAPGGAGPFILNVWPIVASNTYGTQVARVSNTTGNALIAILGCGSNSHQVLPRFNVADDAHNYWQFAGSSPVFAAGQSQRADIWIASNASAASLVSVSESWFTSGVSGLILEVANFPIWTQVDFVAIGSGTGTSATITGMALGTDYIAGGLVTSGPGVASFTTTPVGFSAMQVVGPLSTATDQTSVSVGVVGGQFGAGSITAAWTWSGSTSYTGVLVGFSLAPTAPVQHNPNWPLVRAEAAFGWQPGNLTGIMPTWTDISVRVQDEQGQASFSSSRGRDYELTQPSAGTLQMRLDNHDGAFDPLNVPAANVTFNGSGSNSNPQIELKNGGGKVPVTGNQAVCAGMHLWMSAAWASGMKFGINFYNAGGSLLTTASSTVVTSLTPQLATVNVVAPTLATTADFVVTAIGTPPGGTSFFAAATGLNVASPTFPATLNLTPPAAASWSVIGSAGTVITQQNGWTPSAPYYPYVNPETLVRVTAAWVNTGKIYPIAGVYTNKLPQTFDYPQWGMTGYEGSDGIGMSGQVTLPSALGGDILLDSPYAYFPLGEFYSSAGGEQFSNASRTNLRPAYGVDDTDRNAGFPLQTGQTLNLPGDPGTGIGVSGVPFTPLAFSGAAGAYYRDPGMPQLAQGFTAELEASVTAASGAGNNQVDILRLVGYPGNYPKFAVGAVDGSIEDGTRLILTLARPNGVTPSVTASLSGFAGSLITASSAAGLLTDSNTHHYAVQAFFDGTNWHLTVFMDGQQVASSSGSSVDAGPATYILAMGPVLVGGGQRAISNYILGHVVVYGWVLDPNRITSHATTGRSAGATQTITGRYQRLHAWSLAQLPKATTFVSPSPLAGNADQIQGSSLSDAAYALTVDEGGMYFCDAQFNNWYASRAWFYNKTPKWTFSDQPGQGTFYETATGFDFSDTFLWNITSSQRTVSSSTQTFTGSQNPAQAALGTFNSFGATGNAADLPSEQQYLPRGPLAQPIETTSDQDAYDRANWSLAKYRVPVLRPNQILLTPSANPAAWPVALGAEQGDIVSLSRSPLPAVTMSCLAVIQKIEHRGGPDLWETVLTLSPYFPEGNVVQLDTSPYNTPASGVLPW